MHACPIEEASLPEPLRRDCEESSTKLLRNSKASCAARACYSLLCCSTCKSHLYMHGCHRCAAPRSCCRLRWQVYLVPSPVTHTWADAVKE